MLFGFPLKPMDFKWTKTKKKKRGIFRDTHGEQKIAEIAYKCVRI